MKGDKYQHITDQELLEKFHSDHNNEWLGILLQRYTLLLLGVSMKYLKNEEQAKDSVQQIFLKVIQELHKYKVEYFKSWLYMVAQHRIGAHWLGGAVGTGICQPPVSYSAGDKSNLFCTGLLRLCEVEIA